jgi:mannose-6-phosphate isomerase-like protein (cupin superfamily)
VVVLSGQFSCKVNSRSFSVEAGDKLTFPYKAHFEGKGEFDEYALLIVEEEHRPPRGM